MRVISGLLLAGLLFAQAQENALEKGIAAFNQGKYSDAAAWLSKASDGPERSAYLALTEAAAGGCEKAGRQLAEQFDDLSDPALRRLVGLALAQCHLSNGRTEDAVYVIARLKEIYPGDADVLYESARLHMKAWNDTLYEMFQKTPDSYRVNEISAEIFEIQNRFADAASEYRKAIEKNPRALNLHFRLGRALLLVSHSPENLALARREFEDELKLNASDAAAEYEIGQILTLDAQPSAAAPHFERALAISPNFVEALEALAKSRHEAKRYDEAIALLEKVVRLDPKNESAHYGLMKAYRDAGRSADAAREQAQLDKLRQSPQGEFTDFLKRLGEKAPSQ